MLEAELGQQGECDVLGTVARQGLPAPKKTKELPPLQHQLATSLRPVSRRVGLRGLPSNKEARDTSPHESPVSKRVMGSIER